MTRSFSSSPSVLTNTVPILVWDECTFNSAAEVRICLSSEPAKPEAPSPRQPCSSIGAIGALLTFVVMASLAAAVALTLCFLSSRTNDNALQVRTAGNAEELATRALRATLGMTVTPEQQSAGAASGGAFCVGSNLAENLRRAMEDAFSTTLRSLGAPGVALTVSDTVCDSSTRTAVSTLTLEVLGADLAAAVARALATPEAEQQLASVLGEKLSLPSRLVINQLTVDQ